MRARDVLCLAIAILIVCIGNVACERKVSRFQHLDHLNVECGGKGRPACQSCSSCHGKVAKASQELPPWVKTCESCHDDGVALMNRSLRFARAQSERFERITFPHDKHLSLGPIHGQCVSCHAGVVDQEKGAARSPPMSKCLECHQHDFERANCTPCHERSELPRLLPQTFLRHDAAWLERHGISASRQANICQACHSQTWCADCHEQRRGLLVEQRKP
ncbi:MAG TPA: cytochrome c3 family protein, partial [Polyangiaceae bacterium]|nr:cytochrome c3 family protein [Polyangiaceae bacterium]